MASLYARLAERFPAPSRPFAHLPGGGILSYGDVEAQTARYANALTVLGVAIGDRVAVQADKSIEMLILYLACVRAGAVFLPLNPAYTIAEVAYFVGDAEPALIVCRPQDEAAIRALPGGAAVETLDDVGGGSLPAIAAAQPPAFHTVPCADDDFAAILYTSGTTGRSKGAMLSHGNLASNAFVLTDLWRFTGDDVLLHALPIFHTHGLFVATNIVLAAGASMHFLPKFDVDAVLQAMPRSTAMMGVPTFYIRLLGEDRFNRDLASHMRLFISGSAPLSADVHRRFAERSGHAILERYGMTETNMNTSNPYDGARRAGTVGFPLPGVSIRIVDPESRAPLPTGEVGMIAIAGPNVFKGYWRMAEKTAAEFDGEYFLSGDLGLIDADGYVSIVGREKDLIISGGFNVYPAEVEGALDELSAVHESAVIGVPHGDFGEGVVAVVVPREPGFADERAVIGALAERLARFKQPKRVLFVPELPKNSMGKTMKSELRARYADLFELSTQAARETR